MVCFNRHLQLNHNLVHHWIIRKKKCITNYLYFMGSFVDDDKPEMGFVNTVMGSCLIYS